MTRIGLNRAPAALVVIPWEDALPGLETRRMRQWTDSRPARRVSLLQVVERTDAFPKPAAMRRECFADSAQRLDELS